MRWFRNRAEPRTAAEHAADEQKSPRLLFVCGCPRSGTTAFVRLLNGHPGLALGMERYAFRSRRGGFDRSFFEAERFFTIEEGDTFYSDFSVVDDGLDDGALDERFYPEVRRHWADALYRGDKVPRLYRWLDHIVGTFPDARVLYVVRNINAVSHSVRARAEGEPGSFWSAPGFAVSEWNLSLEVAERYLADPRFGVVEYEALFERRADPRPIFRWLGVPDSPDVVTRYEALTGRRRDQLAERLQPSVQPEDAADIAERARLDLYEHARAAAIDVTVREPSVLATRSR
jgi:hypothetical protein